MINTQLIVRRFKKMETKSRYEVISELESQKRKLIQERDGLNDTLKNKEKMLRDIERLKADKIVAMDRDIEDINDDLKHFKSTMEDRKVTIVELIKSVDDSLARFSNLPKKE
jgi:SMC interacting uncharacterized protein involved in chromosome segregation